MADARRAPGAPALAEAAQAVHSIAGEGRSADAALARFDGAAHRSAVRAITLGAVRWYLRLLPAVERLLTHPERVVDLIRALLVVSAHQIEYSRNAPEATVDAAVDAARRLGQGRATGFVNAVLRKFVAQRAGLLGRVDRTLAGRTAHPRWLVDLFEAAWPHHVQGILEANNAHPPMVLRVDLSRLSASEYLAQLAGVGIPGSPAEWAPAAVVLDHPVAVTALPGFQEGWVSVQDAGAQLAPVLLDARPGMRVLDACAAPGGKTGHVLEHTPGLAELVAVDIDPRRVARIQENLQRSRREATLMVADVRQPSTFWDGRPFDRILVDAPCSSTGVIRRHPDIKLLRRAQDIPAFAAVQAEILLAASRMLAPGGRLVYCTCSILPEENEHLTERVRQADPSLRVLELAAEPLAPGAEHRGAGIQLLPGAGAQTDGFYYACFEKTTPGT